MGQALRSRRSLFVVLLLLPAPVMAAPWQLDPNRTLPDDGDVTQKIELVDIDADGFVDLVCANSRGDNFGGDDDAQLSRLIRNEQGANFVTVEGVFEEPDNAYAIRAGDLDRDGDPDLVVGVNFSGASYVLLHDGGSFTRQDILPGQHFSVGDLELGDIDGDGDLDVLAADWGVTQPFGEPGDPGGPLRLWLGDGLGEFSDGAALLPGGMDAFLSWSFDVELLDFDNDFDLDVLAASRGPGPALALRNDGGAQLSIHPIPALANKPINSAFTVVDLDADGALDLVTLQDGFGGGRNTVLVGDGNGNFTDNPGAYWALVDNPIRFDTDAATLDLDGDGTPDLVVLGPQQNPGEVHARLLRNDGSSLVPVAPDGAAFAVTPELTRAFGVQIADLDRDGRDDLAVAVRDAPAASAVLFGGEDVPKDSSAPRVEIHEPLPGLVFPGGTLELRARVHDARTPARWHDFQHDPQLASYSLVEGAPVAHLRRLPYLELAFGLADPGELLDLPDDHASKLIVPGEWYGESLWRMSFTVPDAQPGLVFWRICGIDAAGNKGCTVPADTFLSTRPPRDCGNGQVEPWEDCDDAIDPMCHNCTWTCGDGLCVAPEDADNCPEDCAACDLDGACEPHEDPDVCCDCTICDSNCGNDSCDIGRGETALNCPEDCRCGDDLCDASESSVTCPEDCGVCGDGVCNANEERDDCPGDCHVCGDCICDFPVEDADNCPEDCADDGSCDPPTGGWWCNDGVCDPNEDAESCPADCSFCGDCICAPHEADGSCPSDCGGGCQCGDGVCGAGEDDGSCPQDCGYCGDCLCQVAETPASCPEDCGEGDICVLGEDAGTSGGGAVDDGLGCGCREAPGGGLALGLLLLARRRRKRHALKSML